MSIGAVMASVFSIMEVEQSHVLKSMCLGLAIGFLVYSIVMLFGISYRTDIDFTYVAIDFTWQIFEQGVGGIVLGLVYKQVKILEERWAQ